MIHKLKTVAKILSYLIRRVFITLNSYTNNILQIIQQTVAVDEKYLHYIKKKIVTQKEKLLVTGELAPLFI